MRIHVPTNRLVDDERADIVLANDCPPGMIYLTVDDIDVELSINQADELCQAIRLMADTRREE